MANLRKWILSALPQPISSALRSFRRDFRGVLDRLFFPCWLIFQCAVHRQRAVILWRTAAMGDIICTLPMCREIRKRHPGRLLVFITVRSYKQLIVLSRTADLIYGVDHTYGKRSWAPSAARFVFGLIEHIYEPLTTDERSHGGVKRHLIDDLADSCGITLSERQPRLFPSPEMIQRIQFAHGLKEDLAKGRLLIGINGGHTWPVREWDVVKWQSAIDQIHANFDAVILQFGLSLGPGMPDPYNHLKGVRLLANALKLEDLVALIAGCHLVISIDSGPIHVAGAVGTPVVGLFGAVNPLYRLPVASPSVGVVSDVPCLFCHHRTPIEHWKTDCPYGIRCMKLLEVPVVFQAIQELLSKSKKESFGTISPQAD